MSNQPKIIRNIRKASNKNTKHKTIKSETTIWRKETVWEEKNVKNTLFTYVTKRCDNIASTKQRTRCLL